MKKYRKGALGALPVPELINSLIGIKGDAKRDDAADKVVIFGNPCTMQIIAKHWSDEILKLTASSVNAPLIKKYTGVDNYKGRADQIKEVMQHITAENYVDMCKWVVNLGSDDSVTGSSNFDKFVKLFESDDSGWIEKINMDVEFYE